MIKLYTHHIVFTIGKKWLKIDRTGIMTWNGKRNHYFKLSTLGTLGDLPQVFKTK
jgi:hypothetical protein